MRLLKSVARRIYDVICPLTKSKRFLFACLGLAFIFRLIWILLVDNKQVSDFILYLGWGKGIAAGHGYAIEGHPTAYYPVGYPAFLGFIFYIFGESELLAKVANALLYLGIIFFSYKLALELFRSRFIAGVTALILTFHPSHIAYTSILISETLFTFLTLMGVWLLVRAKPAAWIVFLAGLVFGAANLVRPLGAGVMIVVFAVVWISSQDRKLYKRWALLSVLLITGHLLALMPYGVRNYMAFHRFLVMPLNGGMNLMLGNNPYASGTYPNDRVINKKVGSLVKHVDDEYEYNKRLNDYAVNYILTHPVETIKKWPAKVIYLYAFEVDGINRNLDGLPKGSKLRYLKIITQGYYMVVMLAAVCAVVLFLIHRKKDPSKYHIPVLGLWILVSWTIIHIIMLGSSRYHYPMVPWIVMYAAAMLRYWAVGKFIPEAEQQLHQEAPLSLVK